MAEPANWPSTRNRVAAVYIAASAGPLMIAMITMSTRWMIVDVTVATARGVVKRQKSRRLVLASRLPTLALTCRADRAARAGAPLSAEAAGVASARSAASSGGTSGNATGRDARSRWIRRSQNQAITAAGR